MSTRLAALRGMFDQLVALCREESAGEIKSMIDESGVEAGECAGLPAAAYDDDETFLRYIFGQWADMLAANSPFLNSARNITLVWGAERGWCE